MNPLLYQLSYAAEMCAKITSRAAIARGQSRQPAALSDRVRENGARGMNQRFVLLKLFKLDGMSRRIMRAWPKMADFGRNCLGGFLRGGGGREKSRQNEAHLPDVQCSGPTGRSDGTEWHRMAQNGTHFQQICRIIALTFRRDLAEFKLERRTLNFERATSNSLLVAVHEFMAARRRRGFERILRLWR
jgi:hypothetical protein